MVERVAVGKLIVPAAAALGLIATSMAGSDQASAASRDTTLQIRVQVVESCQIRVSTVGQLTQSCGGGGVGAPLPSLPSLPALPSLPSLPALPSLPTLPSLPKLEALPSDGLASLVRFDPAERVDRANQRATGVAKRIAQRVRYITVVY